jgi:hypothetical protein
MQKLFLYSTLSLIFIVTLIVACGKDKFETKPTIEIKSIGPNPVPLNSDMVVELEYTDKEGDIADSLFIKKVRINQKRLATIRDSFYLALPTDAPEKNKGTIKLTLKYQDHLISASNPGAPPNAVPDSIIFRFALRDKAKNTSDTIESNLVVIERQ